MILMCGIVGYIGKNNALPKLIKGLKRLEYRGYDSAGIAYFKNKEIILKKSVGRIANLEEKINLQDESFIGIGHTRWATHGKVVEENSHPHQVGNITLVHNGIIENYLPLKKELQEKGYSFKSETDTEVACAYLDYLLEKNKKMPFTEILKQAANTFIGSFAFVILVKGIDNQLFVLKRESPLVIGIGNKEFYVASDFQAYLEETKEYFILEDNDICQIENNALHLYREGKEIPYKTNILEDNISSPSLNNNKHYMLKEIKEQSVLISKWNQIYLEKGKELPDITKYKRIDIIACGTAYHAGLIGKYLIEKNTDFEVNVYVASEYRYQKVHLNKESLVIAISQSGETADTLSCVKLAKKNNAKTLGIINVYNSSIARICDEVIYTNAGIEVSVASTKAYTSQIYILSLLAQEFSQQKIDKNTYTTLPQKVEKLIEKDYTKIGRQLITKKDVFFLGRRIDYISMLEGSLKLKEITYIHSEAFPAGELKHGPISLIEEKTPVISLITDKTTALKTISNIKEVKARGAYVILIIKEGIVPTLDKTIYDEIITLPPSDNYTMPIISIIPLQLIAYYTALLKGVDIDKPRNLAKSVTVE